MITHDRYVEITGDLVTTEAKAERCITDAVDLLEDFLGRPLARAERTVQLTPDRAGNLWPPATPLISVEGYEIRGLAIVASAPFPLTWFVGSDDGTVEITYVGGWLDQRAEDYEPDDDEFPLPACIARDLAFAAHRIAHPTGTLQATGFPAGATSVRLGDAAVTFDSGSSGAAVQSDASWWSPRTRGYRHRTMHSRVPV